MEYTILDYCDKLNMQATGAKPKISSFDFRFSARDFL